MRAFTRKYRRGFDGTVERNKNFGANNLSQKDKRVSLDIPSAVDKTGSVVSKPKRMDKSNSPRVFASEMRNPR